MARIQVAVVLALLLVPQLSAQCETGQILGPVGDPGARMGGSVALAGDTLVVGLPSSDAYGSASGEVRVYRKLGVSWVLTQSLGALASATTGDHFGTSVSIEAPYIAIGADAADGSKIDEGAVYVFKDNGSGTFALQQKLLVQSFMSSVGQAFGCSVSVSAGWLIVGAKHADLGGTDAGAAFVYQGTGSGWSLENTLQSGFNSAGQLFGASVSTKNGLFAVGIPQYDWKILSGSELVTLPDSGAVRVYYLDDQHLDNDFVELSGPYPPQTGARFGSAVAISDMALAVAAAQQDSGATDSGAVHVFRTTASTDWQMEVYKGWPFDQTLTSPTPQAFGEFGSSIALDGTTLVVASRLQDKLPATDTGALDVYRRAGPVWEHRKHLDPGQAAQADFVGSSVAVSGPWFAAGAPGDDVSGAVDAGSATLWSMTDCPGLYASHTTTTNSLPQPVQFSLNAGPSYAFKQYVLLGSLSGMSPGFNLHGAHVPLNLDAYSAFIATSTGWPAFWGQLDATGKATSSLPMPLYFPPFVLDITQHHAFIAKGTPGTPWFASNAEPLAYVKLWTSDPWANAGSDLSGDEESYGGGATVHFNGLGSDSPNGGIVQWHWDFGDGQFGVGPSPDHLYHDPNKNAWVATLTVIDNVGAGAQDTRAIHINKMPLGVIEVLTPNPIAGQPVWFSGKQSKDPDGSISSFQWTFDGNTVVIPGNQTDLSWTFDFGDLFKVSMTPIDDDGLAGSNIAEAFVDVAPCTPPATPTGLTASATSSTTAQLNWQDEASDEISYDVIRHDPSGLWHLIGNDLPANSTSFVATGLTPNQTYEFLVQCESTCNLSDWSNVASVTPSCPTPNPPSNLAGSATSATTVFLTWQDHATNESAYRVSMNSIDISGDLPPNTTSFPVNGLAAGQTYQFKVRCKNACGDSPTSNQASVTTPCPSPTPAPFNCLAKRISNTSQPDPVKVTWSYSGPPVTAFKVARLDPGEDENDFGAWDNVGGDLPPTQFSYTDSFNLQNGQTYKYKVRNFINYGPPCGKVFSEYSNIDVANP